MRIATNFSEWWKGHPELHEKVRPIKGSKKWAELICSVSYKDSFFPKESRRVVCLSSKSKYAGNIYNNDSFVVLWVKFVALSAIVRPLHTIMLIAYHALGIESVRILIKSRKQKEAISKIALKILQSYADTFRVLYYESILIGTAAVASVGGLFKHTFLYDCRAYTDLIQRKLMRDIRTEWCGSPCMYRIANLTFFEHYIQEPIHQIKYPSLDPVTVGLINLVSRSSG